MLVLLPPSEGKTPAPDGARPVDLGSLSSPVLGPQRERVLDALVAASALPEAVEVLGVSPGLEPEVRRNTGLRSAPAAPAAQVYTGVLFAAADLAGALDAGGETARRASDGVRVVSGLWGALSPADRVPAYRLSMGVTLPGVGRLATAWRPHLAEVLDARAAGDVVVDCRSATYAAAWTPRTSGEDAPQHVAVRVLREQDGRRTVVSHHAKHTRGVLTGHLLRRPGVVASVDDLAKAADELVGTALLDAAVTEGGRGRLTLELVVA
ncbi:YaaA family protein [Cellulosimicrobium sp. NPDC057127]|uniref:YaaA family protein n=1 Tax=Cellulosimicrobium sp. NPDC057127 TaxID=3346026 RepID=UPI003642A416